MTSTPNERRYGAIFGACLGAAMVDEPKKHLIIHTLDALSANIYRSHARSLANHIIDLWREDKGRWDNPTRLAIEDQWFGRNPQGSAKDVWTKAPDGDKPVSNSMLDRAVVVGILRPLDMNWTVSKAVEMCKVTHYDPKCVAASVALSVLIAGLIRGWDPNDALIEAQARASRIHMGITPWIRTPADLDGLALAHEPVDHPYKALAVAAWALRRFDDVGGFVGRAGLADAAGGDVGTFSMILGSLAGACAGINTISPKLLSVYSGRTSVRTLVSKTIAVFGSVESEDVQVL